MHNSPNERVNFHKKFKKGNYPVIPIYAARRVVDTNDVKLCRKYLHSLMCIKLAFYAHR